MEHKTPKSKKPTPNNNSTFNFPIENLSPVSHTYSVSVANSSFLTEAILQLEKERPFSNVLQLNPMQSSDENWLSKNDNELGISKLESSRNFRIHKLTSDKNTVNEFEFSSVQTKESEKINRIRQDGSFIQIDDYQNFKNYSRALPELGKNTRIVKLGFGSGKTAASPNQIEEEEERKKFEYFSRENSCQKEVRPFDPRSPAKKNKNERRGNLKTPLLNFNIKNQFEKISNQKKKRGKSTEESFAKRGEKFGIRPRRSDSVIREITEYPKLESYGFKFENLAKEIRMNRELKKAANGSLKMLRGMKTVLKNLKRGGVRGETGNYKISTIDDCIKGEEELKNAKCVLGNDFFVSL